MIADKGWLRVGTAGQMFAGKTTVADILVRVYGFKKIAFANPFKEDILALVQKRAPQVTWEWMDSNKDIFRTTWQSYANDLMKQVLGNDCWTQIAVANAQEHLGPVVVDDMRFPVEEEHWRGIGGIVLNVETPEKMRKHFAEVKLKKSITMAEWTRQHAHVSEKCKLNADITLYNIGDKNELEHKVRTLVSSWSERGYRF